MRRVIPFLAAAALVLLLVGPAPAGIELPDGFDPDDYQPGAYLLGAEGGNSWTQRIWVNTSNLGVSGSWQKVNYQFRICTNVDTYPTLGPQQFTAPEAFKLYGYGQGYETVWAEAFAPHKGVNDALMWANGSPTGAGSGDMVYITFEKGTVDTYVGPDEWFSVPEFVLQMQAYGYKAGLPVQRILNVEFYSHGAPNTGTTELWGPGDSASQPRPALASGATFLSGQTWACPEWTQNSPIPEPASMAVWGLLGGLGIAGAWWRRRRKAA